MAMSFGSRREQRTDWARANQATEKRRPAIDTRRIRIDARQDN